MLLDEFLPFDFSKKRVSTIWINGMLNGSMGSKSKKGKKWLSSCMSLLCVLSYNLADNVSFML
jgi:hypothetical protein